MQVVTEKTTSTKDKLQQLWDSFAEQLPQKVEQIREDWSRVQSLRVDSKEMKSFTLMLHNLAGTAPSFGFTAMGVAVRDIESLIQNMEGDSLPSRHVKEKIGTKITELAALSAIRSEPTDLQTGALQVEARYATSGEIGRLIFVVDDDKALVEHLAVQIECFGYDVHAFNDIKEMKKALKFSTPEVIISDMSFPDGNFAGADEIMALRREEGLGIPAIFMSQRNQLEARIKAANAGGEAYFLKPVAMCDLIEKLDNLVFGAVQEPYRILIVDDDQELSELHAAILKEHGMVVRVVNDPMQILKHMVGFRPDLVLLDMYMPGCNGDELARAIRQIEDYNGIPIVFLSAETCVDKQVDAIRMGGDDFLTKPIRPEFLISSINIRAERMRIMRTFMVRDSLTGLFNLVNIQAQLETTLARAKKNNSPVVYALIELDNFQAVNDTHGYLAGNRAIVIAALLLKRRVRSADVVGRYGGQKFVVIMPDIDAEAAFTVLDEIRTSFAKILHRCHSGEFYLTLSGGCAVYPDAKDVASLNSLSGKALAEARDMGRNRIVMAGSQ